MSFTNTKTPKKPTGKAQFQCPMRRSAKGPEEYYLTPELEEEFRKRFPVTMNRRIMQLFGISFSTMQRFKRELNLEKDNKVIRKKLAAQIKRTCEANGYYDSIRGIAPSEQTLEATRKLRAEGFIPWLRLKELDPKTYKRKRKKQGKNRKELMAKEKRRIEIGLTPHTRLHLPQQLYSRTQLSRRSRAKKLGYILGDMHDDSGERMMLFYTSDTKRGEIFERNCIADGFYIEPLPKKSNVKPSKGWNV